MDGLPYRTHSWQADAFGREILRLAEREKDWIRIINEAMVALGLPEGSIEEDFLEAVSNAVVTHREMEAESEALVNACEEIAERDRLNEALVSLLGLDREALDREGKPVGDAILEAAHRLVLENRREQPLTGCSHKNCANCLTFALLWRDGLPDEWLN